MSNQIEQKNSGSSGSTTHNYAAIINNATGTTLNDGAVKLGIQNMGGQNNDYSGQIGMHFETKNFSGNEAEKGNVIASKIFVSLVLLSMD